MYCFSFMSIVDMLTIVPVWVDIYAQQNLNGLSTASSEVADILRYVCGSLWAARSYVAQAYLWRIVPAGCFECFVPCAWCGWFGLRHRMRCISSCFGWGSPCSASFSLRPACFSRWSTWMMMTNQWRSMRCVRMCGSQRVHTPHPASLLCQIIYYMTSTVIGRPRVPSDSLIGHLVLIITIVLSATAIPSILAPLVKVWVEAGVLAWVRVHTPTSDLKLCVACAGLTQSYHIVADARPHVIVTGHVDPQRLGAFLGQFFDDSRALSQVCTIPVLCSCL